MSRSPFAVTTRLAGAGRPIVRTNAFRAGLLTIAMACAFAPCFAAVADAGTEKVLYSFGKNRGGWQPFTGMIGVNGDLYGTTPPGGGHGGGVLYQLNPKTGKQKRLWGFRPTHEGSIPQAGVTNVNGLIYGTTTYGGANCQAGGVCGAVFAFDLKTRNKKTVYSFCAQENCLDGKDPDSSLVDVKDTLYGATAAGGAEGKGAVFALDRNTGAENVLYSFCSLQNCADGEQPNTLVYVDGLLYGATYNGGGSSNLGVLFSVDAKSGMETVLHAFTGGADGAHPTSLVAMNGVLYGIASRGGLNADNTCVSRAWGPGCGTVFALDPKTGAETIVYSFCRQQRCADGAIPSGLAAVNGALYGTTLYGGGRYDGGVLFSLNPKTSAESVLYSFCATYQSCPDGAGPDGNLIEEGGKFYGTTMAGGGYGVGTAFEVKP
jgi:uncharacterized repeat protein (TIGR03803 family)